tara:strand:+ start:6898 stop:8862 length:1965 start_codon:yes stop_codon:yes gene_type:complete
MTPIQQLAKAAMDKQAGSYKSNLGPELAKGISNSRPQNKPGFIPPLPANPPPGAAQVIRNLPAFENAMKAFRGIDILPPEVPAKAPAKKPAPALEKAGSTALVRAIQLGLKGGKQLSPKSIGRAAAAMKPGQFRTIKPLGSGVYNKADLIVGNVGSHAGVGVRKLPTHKFVNPKQNYRGIQAEVGRLNKLLPTETGVPAVAPYYHVGNRGAFQQFTGDLGVKGTKSFKPAPSIWNNHVPNKVRIQQLKAIQDNTSTTPSSLKELQRRVASGGAPETPYVADAVKHMSDLHYDNVGPGGQIHDFVSRLDPGIGTVQHHPGVNKLDWGQYARRDRLVRQHLRPPKNNWQKIKGMLQNLFGVKPNLNLPGTEDFGNIAATREGRKNTAIHKWYDATPQAQRNLTPGALDSLSAMIPKHAADAPLSWNTGVIRDAKWLNKKQEKARIGHNTGQYSRGTTNWLDHLLRMPGGNAPTIEAPRGIGLPADVPKAHGNSLTSNDPRSHMTSAELGAHNKGASAEDMPYQFGKTAQLGRLAAMEKMASLGMLLGGTIGAGIGRHRAGEGDDVRRATARGAVRGGFTGSGATIGGGLGLLGSLALMKGEPSTTKGIISALLPLLGAGVGGYGGYLAGDSLLDDDDKATELEDLRRDNSSEEYKE